MAEEEYRNRRNDPGERSGLLNTNLKPVTKAWRAATFGQPLVGAAYAAAAMASAGYHFAPWFKKQFVRFVSPAMSEKDKKDLEAGDPPEGSEEDKSTRRTAAWVLGMLGGLTVLAANLRPGDKDYGLLHYEPMEKTGSGSYSSLPLGQCIDMIRYDSKLEPYVKGQALNLLESFSAPPSQPVNGGDLVGQAIVTGQSAATGLGIGWLTAKVLGLPNPKSTAILGAVANTLGPWAALSTSLAFGH